MYTYFNNTLCIEQSRIVNEIGYKLDTIQKYIKRGKLVRARKGGNGRSSLIEFETIEVSELKEQIIAIAGDPKKKAAQSILESHITKDYDAATFFTSFRKDNGKPLTFKKQIEYTTNAMILNAIDTIVISKQTSNRRLTGNKTRLWENISNAVNQLPSDKYPHSIPGNYRSIERAYKKYKKQGYGSLVHGGIGNDNRTKITGPVADYILAVYCLPNKPMIPTVLAMYDNVRTTKGWPTLSESAVQQFLDKPENQRVWTLARHGRDEYDRKYGHKLSRDRSLWFPNAYWAIDGSKLDWIHYFDNELGMAAKLKMNPVFDVYSEVILGNSYSETERHTDHFTSLKAAMNYSQKRPYKLTYDNQSGHKSKRMQELYDGIIAKNGGVHHPTAPNRKSNPVEQIFNRFQQQVISTFWFSDKQSIKSRDINNKPNIDFIKENRHKLLTREDLLKAWEVAVHKWNNAPHPTIAGKTRMEVYLEAAPMSESIDFLDMITLFWVDESTPITYKNDGLSIRISGERYMFEVYTSDDKIDLEFRRLNVGKKFIVRYDPEELDNYVQLIELTPEGEKVFVAHAQPKRKHQEIPVLMEEGDKELWAEDYSIRDKELERDQKELEALRQRTGITPEQLIEDQDLMIKMGGDLPKDTRSEVESNSVFNYL